MAYNAVCTMIQPTGKKSLWPSRYFHLAAHCYTYSNPERFIIHSSSAEMTNRCTSSCRRNGKNVSHRHKIASRNKNDVLDRKILSHNDWQIVTDVSKDRIAYIFRVKLSLTTVLYNCVNEGIRNKEVICETTEVEPSPPHTLAKDIKIFIYTSI